MRIQPKDLSHHLSRGLAPVYFIGGEEPLQRMEALDSIRAQVKNHGYTEREVIEFLASKDEDRLWTILNTPSLFAQKRLIECRLKEGKNTKLIQGILQNIIPNIPLDTVLVIFYPDKLDAATLKSSWFATLDRAAIITIAALIPQGKYTSWLQERAKTLNLSFTREALLFLAQRTEGNLVAASQTLEKIALIHPPLITPTTATKALTIAELAPLMVWENRHSVFDLGDSLLQGAYARTYRILESLRNEGIEPSLVCWAIAREVRGLIPLSESLALEGRLTDAVMDSFRVWNQRRHLVSTFLHRHSLSSLYDILTQAKNLDTIIKTEHPKKAWQALQNLCYLCCRGENQCQVA